MIKSNKMIREQKDSNLISFIRFRFVPYWPLFALLLFIAVAAAFVDTFFEGALADVPAGLDDPACLVAGLEGFCDISVILGAPGWRINAVVSSS